VDVGRVRPVHRVHDGILFSGDKAKFYCERLRNHQCPYITFVCAVGIEFVDHQEREVVTGGELYCGTRVGANTVVVHLITVDARIEGHYICYDPVAPYIQRHVPFTWLIVA
jgi:hypothetical protein